MRGRKTDSSLYCTLSLPSSIPLISFSLPRLLPHLSSPSYPQYDNLEALARGVGGPGAGLHIGLLPESDAVLCDRILRGLVGRARDEEMKETYTRAR